MTSSIWKITAVMAAVVLVAGCGGEGSSGKDNPFQPDPPASGGDGGDGGGDTGDGGDDGGDGSGPGTGTPEFGGGDANEMMIPDSLSNNLTSAALSADGTTLAVEITGIDGTPQAATYNRNPAMDTGDYLAFSIQEDALDRLFVALGRDSDDGTTRAYAVHGNAQFNRFLEGGYYERDGGFDAPDVGDGPGAGQVSYAGTYAGFTNIGSPDGDNLLPGAENEDLAVRPREDARVVGNIFLNANFADNEVNGAIYNRVALDPNTGDNSVDNLEFEDIALLLAPIDTDGTFFGDAEVRGEIDQDIGDYGGIFGGENSAAVAGVTRFENFDERFQSEIEHGVFVLTQCGRPNDDAICDLVEPNP